MKAIMAALLLAGLAVPSVAQTVQSAEGDWSSLPPLKFGDLDSISAQVPEAMQKLVASGKCQLRGVSGRGVDMSVPFLVRFSPTGEVQDVVVRKLGCSKAEAILALPLSSWHKRGR